MHYTTRKFWDCYNVLPSTVQATADQCYELLKADRLILLEHFKKVGNY